MLWDSRGDRLRRGVPVCGLAARYVAELVANWRSMGDKPKIAPGCLDG